MYEYPESVSSCSVCWGPLHIVLCSLMMFSITDYLWSAYHMHPLQIGQHLCRYFSPDSEPGIVFTGSNYTQPSLTDLLSKYNVRSLELDFYEDNEGGTFQVSTSTNKSSLIVTEYRARYTVFIAVKFLTFLEVTLVSRGHSVHSENRLVSSMHCQFRVKSFQAAEFL